jgi:glycosyltransferase involved in cell wall biosynthesis
MTKIVIISGIQVIDNPRVVKEADALSEAGHEVEVLAAIHDAASARRTEHLLAGRPWRHTAVLDLVSTSLRDRVAGFSARLAWRIARAIKTTFNVESPDQLGPATRPLYAVARRRDADLYIVHVPEALWSGVKLLGAGRRVAFDMEDWYSEDGLPQDRARQPVRLMRRYERALLQQAAYVTTTSNAMAEALASAYAAPRPAVVYNSFPIEDRDRIDALTKDRRDLAVPSIVWFSQTIGPGRGLEALVAALDGIDEPFELHIRGTARPGYREALLDGASERLRSRIHFHARVPQDELLSRLAEHDIGYCGELSDCASRDLTITNKAFEYMRAGLAIVATDTTGQVEVARRAPSALRLFRQEDVADLTRQIRALLLDPDELARSKGAARQALRDCFGWAAQKATIQDLARAAIHSTSSSTAKSLCDA